MEQRARQPEPCREELGWTGCGARSLTVHAARLPGPPPRGAVLVLHDTTDLRRLERLRQDFVANVSHELKTPLSVIKLCAETLLDGAVDDPDHRGRFLEQIVGQSERLHVLILDLLSLARIESGEELFEFEAVCGGGPWSPPAWSVTGRGRSEAGRRWTTAGRRIGALPVWADEEAVEQILDNLLDNALKYTPEGGRIRVGWGEENGQVWVEVADDGIGIPGADLPRIFERFYRVDKAPRAKWAAPAWACPSSSTWPRPCKAASGRQPRRTAAPPSRFVCLGAAPCGVRRPGESADNRNSPSHLHQIHTLTP